MEHYAKYIEALGSKLREAVSEEDFYQVLMDEFILLKEFKIPARSLLDRMKNYELFNTNKVNLLSRMLQDILARIENPPQNFNLEFVVKQFFNNLRRVSHETIFGNPEPTESMILDIEVSLNYINEPLKYNSLKTAIINSHNLQLLLTVVAHFFQQSLQIAEENKVNGIITKFPRTLLNKFLNEIAKYLNKYPAHSIKANWLELITKRTLQSCTINFKQELKIRIQEDILEIVKRLGLSDKNYVVEQILTNIKSSKAFNSKRKALSLHKIANTDPDDYKIGLAKLALHIEYISKQSNKLRDISAFINENNYAAVTVRSELASYLEDLTQIFTAYSEQELITEEKHYQDIIKLHASISAVIEHCYQNTDTLIENLHDITQFYFVTNFIFYNSHAPVFTFDEQQYLGLTQDIKTFFMDLNASIATLEQHFNSFKTLIAESTHANNANLRTLQCINEVITTISNSHEIWSKQVWAGGTEVEINGIKYFYPDGAAKLQKLSEKTFTNIVERALEISTICMSLGNGHEFTLFSIPITDPRNNITKEFYKPLRLFTSDAIAKPEVTNAIFQELATFKEKYVKTTLLTKILVERPIHRTTQFTRTG